MNGKFDIFAIEYVFDQIVAQSCVSYTTTTKCKPRDKF